MLDALMLTATLVAGPTTETPAHRQVSNAWQDSGHDVWKGTPRWVRDLGRCIRHHESIHAGHYKADNDSSTASGAYQFLQATWDGNAKWTKVVGTYVARKYVGVAPSQVPPWVQDAVFIHSIKHGGIHNWDGTGCAGTTGDAL